jgi:hypothetical protein
MCTGAGTAIVYVQTPERKEMSLSHMKSDTKKKNSGKQPKRNVTFKRGGYKPYLCNKN